ncbi:MAG: phage recombination protein Bet [Beijerinckiaceae bacterium]|nr:phage recombination protein Bet [Beijerinckiaceae bacterium]
MTSVSFNNLRLPYDDVFAEGFGIDNIRWKVLIDTVYPAAKTVESIAMALSYCKARNLDVFKRPIHIVPMWSSAANKMIETVWPGIAELRTTAARTGEYAGCGAAEFGPEREQHFSGKFDNWENGKKNGTYTKDETVVFPDWCQITVRRIIKGHLVDFVGPKVFWLESYGRVGKTDVPNDMWCKRPFGQIEKCAEAAALRRAFPEEIGNEYTAEEMEGHALLIAPSEPETPAAKLPPPPPPPPEPGAPPPETAAPRETTPPAPPPPPAPPQAAKTPPAPPPPAKPKGFDFHALRSALKGAGSLDDINAVYDRMVQPIAATLPQEVHDEIDSMVRDAGAEYWVN